MSKLTQEEKGVHVVHPICCGIDVHKRSLSACIIKTDSDGKIERLVKKFGTMTDDLIEFLSWLKSHDCPVAAIESTGVYWRPIHNVLEGCVDVILANARHIKHVPGRKTDILDCQWIADLLRHGLIKGSFIPDKKTRHIRELVRTRKNYVETVGDFKRRIHDVFECANIKTGSVVTDLFGVTGRNLIHLVLSKDSEYITLEDVACCARGTLKKKVIELWRSIQGYFTQHHRELVRMLMKTVAQLEGMIATLDRTIEKKTQQDSELKQRLDRVPGINERAAQGVLGEVGNNLHVFETEGAFCSWVGVTPNNEESAGKQKSKKSQVRGHSFKTLLVEIAWAAIKTKGSFYKAKYYRLKARRGAKRAIVSIAHKIARCIYYIIKTGSDYYELGENYMSKREHKNKLSNIQRQAKQLGYELTLIES